MLTRFNSILIFKIIRFYVRYLICGSFMFFSCEEADYNLDNPNDPENMDLEPPALFFHPQEIQTNLDSSFCRHIFSKTLYGFSSNNFSTNCCLYCNFVILSGYGFFYLFTKRFRSPKGN